VIDNQVGDAVTGESGHVVLATVTARDDFAGRSTVRFGVGGRSTVRFGVGGRTTLYTS
jgi:hypothetical protein